MSDPTRKRSKADSPGLQPLPGQGILPCCPDAADGAETPDVQANGQAASNGQVEVHGEAVADRDGPEADPFDLEFLRLSADFASAVGVRKLIKTVPVRKPSREWFIRTHPDPDYRRQADVLELREDREVYLVSQSLGCSPILGPPQMRVPSGECCYSDTCKSNEQSRSRLRCRPR